METAAAQLSTRRWWILGTILIGTLVGTFGNSMTPVALPAIMDQYDIGLDVGVWVVSVYILLFSTPMPLFGKLGDMIGYKRMFVGAMAGLALAMFLSAFAPSAGWLIAFRVVAGICNAPILPAIMGIVAEVFPAQERGGALGFWATTNGTAHGLGPVISGLIVQHFGWPWVYLFNGALTVAGLILIVRFVPRDEKRTASTFDPIGAATLTLAAILFMFNLTQGFEGQYSPPVVAALWAGFALLVAAFIISQMKIPNPFVDLRLFRERGYTEVMLVSGAQLFCLFGMQLLLPLFLIGQQNRPSGNAGLLIAPLAVSLALFSPAAGRLSDYVGSRMTCIIGMGIVALAGLALTFWAPATPAWLIVLTLMVLGSGMSLTQSPTANAVTLVVGKDKLGVALGIFNMFRFVMGTLGATAFGVIIERGAGVGGGLPAFHTAFYLFTAVAAAATVLAFRMPAISRHQLMAVEQR
jgi:EmrB/QacA subfamily drug resistance transporter